MNKKIIFLFLFIICVLSTISISVWGKVPESDGNIHVSSINILDPSKEDRQCVLNDGQKVISIARGTTTYQLEVEFNPSDATNKTLTYTITSGRENATIDENGLITFTSESPITIRVYSNREDARVDSVYIEFTGPIISDNPDDNPF